MGCNILLISEDKNFAHSLAAKLLFLRDDDKVSVCAYSEVKTCTELNNSQIVLVHEGLSKQLTINLIKELRVNKNLCIILLASSYNSEMILSAYDCGIDDFALCTADDFELVTRVVNNIKHNSVKLTANRNVKVLEQLNVVDELTGFYNYKYAKQLFENIVSDDDLFMAVSTSNNFKPKFSTEKTASAIKASIRVDDAVALGRGACFYILLKKTDINGAIVVLNKIKENYGSDFEICAGISNICENSFDKVEQETLQALAGAAATGAEFAVVQDDKEATLDEWLDVENPKQKNYKIFRQMFSKKLEKVITPVFYSLQNAWEEKLFNTEIIQCVNSEQCLFRLKNNKHDSTLRIIYPGFTKIVISITHEGLDSPENTEIQIPLTKVTQKELVKRVEDFIKTFKSIL